MIKRKLYAIKDYPREIQVYDKNPGQKRSNGRWFRFGNAASILFVGKEKFDKDGDGLVLISNNDQTYIQGYIKRSDFFTLPLVDFDGNNLKE
jgi:hypothetical protein